MIDFLIIGGGMAGTSTAARLAPFGQVVLLEMESAFGYHASGRSAALYEAHYGQPATVEMNLAGRVYFDDGGYLKQRGFMIVASKAERQGFETASKELHCDPISFAEAQAIVPILNPETVQLTSYFADCHDIDTDRLLQDFAKTARAAGAELLTDQQVTAIKRLHKGWHVTTPKRSFECRVLVNAAGAWADKIAALAQIPTIGLKPMRRSMARIPAPGGHDLSGWPMLMDAFERWYAKPDAGKLLVSPAEEDPQEPHDAWADDMVLAEGIDRYQHYVTEEVTRLESSWAGLRSFAPDRNLVIGPDPQDHSFFWVAGQGGFGIQSAPAYSQLAADLLGGQSSAFDQQIRDAVSPARFR